MINEIKQFIKSTIKLFDEKRYLFASAYLLGLFIRDPKIFVLSVSVLYIFSFLFVALDDLVDYIIDKIKHYFNYTRKGTKPPISRPFDIDELFPKRPIRDLYLDFIYRPLYRFRTSPKDAKFYIKRSYQRSTRGWADSDSWCVSSFMSPNILGMVKRLKEKKHGVPCQVFDDPNDDSDKGFKKAHKKWNKILDKIIYTFEIAVKISEKDLYYQPSEDYDQKLANSLRKMHKESDQKRLLKGRKPLYGNSGNVLTKKECEKYEEGWKLFQAYYFNLWD